MAKQQFHFEGFTEPNYTMVPDEVFDVLLPALSLPELKVLLYITRRTFGFKKRSDDISLHQLVNGIRTRDGRVLDSGTGLSRSSVRRGISGLLAKGVIVARQNHSTAKGSEPTTYGLRFRGDGQTQTAGVSRDGPGGGSEPDTGDDQVGTPQQTGIQQTERDSSNVRKSDENVIEEIAVALPPKGTQTEGRVGYSEDRRMMIEFTADFGREFGDRAPVKSSATRAYNLFKRSGVGREAFIEAMYQARAITKEQSASIRSHKMAFWFAVLEDLIHDGGDPARGGWDE